MNEPIKLVKPIQFGGSEITEVTLDFDAITGGVLIEVERQFVTAFPQNEGVSLKELSKEYQVLVAAKASQLPVDFFYKIGGRDFSTITMTVQSFFTEAVSAE